MPASPCPCPTPEHLSLTNLPPILSKNLANLAGILQLSPISDPCQLPGVIAAHCSSEGMHHMTLFLMSPAELDKH